MQVDKARLDEMLEDGAGSELSDAARSIIETYGRDTPVDALAMTLFEAWCKADPTSGPATHPASYMATFADMARAALRSLRSTEGKEADDHGSDAAAVEIADAVIAWMVRYDLLDADQEYRDDDILEVLNDLRPDEDYRELKAQAEAAEAHVAKLRGALTPSGDTKAAYSGEFFERVEIANPMFEDNEDDEPETIMQSVPVSWTTIKEIMAAIEARAALTRSPE